MSILDSNIADDVIGSGGVLSGLGVAKVPAKAGILNSISSGVSGLFSSVGGLSGIMTAINPVAGLATMGASMFGGGSDSSITKSSAESGGTFGDFIVNKNSNVILLYILGGLAVLWLLFGKGKAK